MQPASLTAVLDKLGQLPAMPAVVQEVINSFNDPDLEVDELARKIGHDQGLSTRVLRVANSSFYGLPRQIASIYEAVVVLGFATVRSLTLAAGLIHAFPLAGKGLFNREQFWRHSIQVAAAARELAGCAKIDMEIAYTAGLLHNIGQMVLDTCLHEQFDAVLRRQMREGGDLYALEREMLGFDHAMAGAEIARRWNFPEVIQEAILFHPVATQQATGFLPVVIHLANLLARAYAEGMTGKDILPLFPASPQARPQLSVAQLEACLDAIEKAVANTSLLLEK